MPRLIEYVSIGFCSGYGDGDYAISGKVADLSVDQMQELRAIAVCALYQMEDMWRRAQKPELGQKNSDPPSRGEEG